ncbi:MULTISPECIES: protelomerase family protein [unclassified Xanthobacter]|uniref:protelomerase family protein n=1 Tax=unclassified Xanthobacter TaxID=2623496 RepID=UPI001F1ECAC0|nr:MULTISPECIES: protelomerase family protein [unclassified Xanthobacter]
MAAFIEQLRRGPNPEAARRLWEVELAAHAEKALSTRISYVSKYRTEIKVALGEDSPFLNIVVAPVDWVRQMQANQVARVAAPAALMTIPLWREIIQRARELLHSTDPLDVGIGLLTVTGRRPLEAFSQGSFERVPLTQSSGPAFARWAVLFRGQAMTRGQEGTRAGQAYMIPTLAPAKEIITALARLRSSDAAASDLVVKAGETQRLKWADMTSEDFRRAIIERGLLRQRIPELFADLWPGTTGLTAHNFRSLYAEVAYKNFAEGRFTKNSFFSAILGHTAKDLETSFAHMKFVTPDDGDAECALADGQAKREILQRRIFQRLSEVDLLDLPDVHGAADPGIHDRWAAELLSVTENDPGPQPLPDRAHVAASAPGEGSGAISPKARARPAVSAAEPRAASVRTRCVNNIVMTVQQVTTGPNGAPLIAGHDRLSGDHVHVSLMTPGEAAQLLPRRGPERFEDLQSQYAQRFAARPGANLLRPGITVAITGVYEVGPDRSLLARWPQIMQSGSHDVELIHAGLIEIQLRKSEERVSRVHVTDIARSVGLLPENAATIRQLFCPLEGRTLSQLRLIVAMENADGETRSFVLHQVGPALGAAARAALGIAPGTQVAAGELAENDIRDASDAVMNAILYQQEHSKSGALAAAAIASVLSDQDDEELFRSLKIKGSVSAADRSVVRELIGALRSGHGRAAVAPGWSYNAFTKTLSSYLSAAGKGLTGDEAWSGVVGLRTGYVDESGRVERFSQPIVHAAVPEAPSPQKLTLHRLAPCVLRRAASRDPAFAALAHSGAISTLPSPSPSP